MRNIFKTPLAAARDSVAAMRVIGASRATTDLLHAPLRGPGAGGRPSEAERVRPPRRSGGRR